MVSESESESDIDMEISLIDNDGIEDICICAKVTPDKVIVSIPDMVPAVELL